MLRKIDRWVGRHMSKGRWIGAWAVTFGASLVVAIKGGMWGVVIGSCTAAVSLLGLWGNARR